MIGSDHRVLVFHLRRHCPERAVGAAMIMPYATTEAMNKHLVEISATVAPGAHAIRVCDGAGWRQRGKKLEVPDNITLLSLPPYSPELNPMENVWAYLRQNKLCALVWPTDKDILDACQDAWPRRLAKTLGASSSTIPIESAQLESGNGRVSPSRS